MARSQGFDDPRLVREIRRRPDAVIAPAGWPAAVPAVASVLESGLQLPAGVTFLVGENGSGKSTLVEAAAAAYGLGPEGGTVHSAHGTHHTESPLSSWISLVRQPGAPTHSPVLASLPGATIYETGAHGIARREWEDLDLVMNWRSYLNEPHRYLRHIIPAP